MQWVSPELSARLGYERSAGQDGAGTGLSPLTLEAAVRLWTDEAPRLLWGGGLRAELGGSGAVGVVPRVELRHSLGPLEIRPGFALPVFVAPLTMFGPELSGGVRYPLNHYLGIAGYVCVTAFLFGSDVPRDATLLQLSGGFGVDLVL